MNFKGRHILSIGELTKEELLKVIAVASDIDADRENYSSLLHGKILATLFFEPSTRTRMSFQAAMQRMGGSVIGFSDVSMTSIQKGESLPDTIKIVSGYCDVIVMRHPETGSVAKAAADASVPVINAGDGPNEHPTQTILDMYTIKKELGKLEGLKIGFIGDLKFGRTVHSLVTAMSHFNPEFYFVSPPSLNMPDKYLDELKKKKKAYQETEDLISVCKKVDVLYMTRIQKERFPDPLEYEKFKGIYRVDEQFLQNVKKDMKVMHPLPRVDEIDKSVDNTSHAAYFEQAANGIPVRKVLLALVLGRIK